MTRSKGHSLTEKRKYGKAPLDHLVNLYLPRTAGQINCVTAHPVFADDRFDEEWERIYNRVADGLKVNPW